MSDRKPHPRDLDERRIRDRDDFAREMTKFYGPRGFRSSSAFALAGDREEQS